MAISQRLGNDFLVINTGVTKNDVVTLKFTSGEELIGRLVSEDDTTFTVSKPMVLTMNPSGGIGMTPFLFTASENIDIPVYKSALAAQAVKSSKPMADSYLTGTTGIALA